MERLFNRHNIRKVQELSDSIWDFRTFDGSTKKKVTVPSSWQTYPETLTYEGKCIYEKEFRSKGNNRLCFKGVAHTGEVYFDGVKIAEHYNAFTPFDAVIPHVEDGIHKLMVVVDNTLSEASALHVENDYFNYGGITRAVVLEEISDVYLSNMQITPVKKNDSWSLDVKVELRNLSDEDANVKLRFWLENINYGIGEVCSFQDGVDIASSEKRIIRFEIDCPQVKEWSMEEPNLYNAIAVIIDKDDNPMDDLIDRIGFRQVEAKNGRIFLNGKAVRIKGFCRHEEHPQFGSSLPLSAMQQDLFLLKDMGANAVRTSHYPNDEIFLDLCDELGILVWEENHARGLSEEKMKNPNFRRQAMDCIREMIGNHYNHPSIYIWGILNECASDTEYGFNCYKEQFELIKELDKSRPTSFASCNVKTDISLGLPDVVSYNIYPLWYHDTDPKEYMDELYEWIQRETEGCGKPFLITEVGAGAIYGHRSPMHVKWSEEYQADALSRQLTAILESDYCNGVYIWQFCDGKVTKDWWYGRPRSMNNKGIVDEYRRPKLAYNNVKEIFERYEDYLEG